MYFGISPYFTSCVFVQHSCYYVYTDSYQSKTPHPHHLLQKQQGHFQQAEAKYMFIQQH